jgi:ubiquinone/menaquinone biosynthesis C-methylase UbiE
MRRPEFIAEQSRRPSGALGWLIGNIMSHETESLNSAALAALELRPDDRVLEVGFGHGKTIRKAAEIVTGGFVAGVDFSETMLGMARRRCTKFVATGRVRLELADSACLPFPDQHFDKAYSVHTLYFWKDPAAHLREIRRVLAPGGRLVLGLRTNDDGSGAAAFPGAVYTFYGAEAVRELLRASGFADEIVEAAPIAGSGMVVLIAARDRAR